MFERLFDPEAWPWWARSLTNRAAVVALVGVLAPIVLHGHAATDAQTNAIVDLVGQIVSGLALVGVFIGRMRTEKTKNAQIMTAAVTGHIPIAMERRQ